MVQDDVGAVPERQDDTAKAGLRTQTEIEFPYADLENAAGLARAIHSNAGASCEDAELAAWLGMSVEGGTFRSRRSSARMFGLIELSQGRLSLTMLGRRIVNDAESRGARVEAFLKPQLFLAMYEQYRGQALPPPPAIERHMEQLGVPPKQKMRARQVFQKSATYAGYIDPASGRFFKPGAGNTGQEPQPPKPPSKGKGAGGDGDGGDQEIDPIIRGLLARLPKSGEVWPDAERKLWLGILENAFKLIYRDADG